MADRKYISIGNVLSTKNKKIDKACFSILIYYIYIACAFQIFNKCLTFLRRQFLSNLLRVTITILVQDIPTNTPGIEVTVYIKQFDIISVSNH